MLAAAVDVVALGGRGLDSPTAGRSAIVWTELGACTSRSGASTEPEPLGFPSNGACCELQLERGRVRCDALEGDASCLKQTGNVACAGLG